MIINSKEYYIEHTFQEQIRIDIRFRIEELREFYNHKADAIKKFLKVRKLETDDRDEIKIIHEILGALISITNSNNFIKVEHLPVLSDGEDRERVNIIINTTNQKAEELGLDLKYDIFSILKSIEEKIIAYEQRELTPSIF
ncbi:hypothetical protein HMPREF0946_00795 [Fusobacterium vincentii 3_1_36A2]|uniref:Uncharacterized protein n=1 Tax=Fusobacterium vincentii 3_1_36A2 TaxID=469604 RepID=C7XNX1_FUSVC|nr:MULTISPECIES: hypothetical protein [Fusobacterium]EEU32722.1 hypothetical protein HMPREF0946_00795 [Fusobacterium vincentii 3_1_36A2]